MCKEHLQSMRASMHLIYAALRDYSDLDNVGGFYTLNRQLLSFDISVSIVYALSLVPPVCYSRLTLIPARWNDDCLIVAEVG